MAVAQAPPTHSPHRAVAFATPRAIAVAAVVAVAVIFVVAWAELITGQIMIGFLQLPPVLVVALFALVIANRLAARISPRLALTPREMLVVYCFVLFASMVTSRGLMEDLIPVQVGLNYYANEANKWQDLYFRYIQPWMVPWDPTGDPLQPVAVGFYEGLRPGERIPWRPWLTPTLSWLLLVALVYGFFLCISSILYRLWADHELLSFPLVQLPLEMIGERRAPAFLRNRLMWVGFALPVVIFGLNGAHQIWPAIPQITVRFPLNPYFTARPWRDLSYTCIYVSLAATGFFFLLPTELLFSIWFFFVFARFQELVASSLGLPPERAFHAAGKAFLAYQTAGAYFILVAYMLYAAWPRLRDMLARPRQAGELMLPVPVAVWGALACLIGIFLWTSAAGMSLPAAALEFGIYLFVQAIIMARSTAEAGLPMTEGSFTPLDIFRMFSIAPRFGKRNLTVLAFCDALFSRDLRGLVLTGFLDAQKVADGVGVPRSRMAPLMAGSIAFAIPFAAFFHLYLPYRYGAVRMYSYVYRGNAIQFWRENAPYMRGQDELSWQRPAFFAVGVLATAWLAAMRRQFVWWPFHPLAYALCCSWTVVVFWFSALLAWIVKSAIQRYGGVRSYHRARPFFLGLIFGEFFMGVFWTVISAIFGTRAPFMPWP